MFTCVFIPCDNADETREVQFSKEGGLAADQLRLHVDSYFCAKSGGNALTDVGAEIIVVSLPCAENSFIGVSLYCGRDTNEYPVNTRATSVLGLCGHKTVVRGDAYLGRYLDDERIEWERLDFKLSDMSSDAPWLVRTQAQNRGKNLGGMSTSGTLQNMMNQQKQSEQTEMTAGLVSTVKCKGSEGGIGKGNISWSESADEVEVVLNLRSDIQKKDMKVVFSNQKLVEIFINGNHMNKAALKDSASEMSADDEALLRPEGLQLRHAIDTTCCTWTYESGRLSISLSKKEEGRMWGGVVA